MKLSDWLRAGFLAVGFAALGWFLLNRYTPSDRFEPHRRAIQAFLVAARAGDSARLRALVSSEQPLQWARAAAARTPALLPASDGTLDIQGANRSGKIEEVVVWTGAPCAEQPLFVTFLTEGRNRRIEAVRTKCGAEPP